jgi:hypothetical protein
VLVLASGLGAALWAVDRSNDAARDNERIEALEETATERADAVDQLADGLDEARTQLEDLGVEPEVPPPEDVVNGAEIRPRGEQGEPGEAGEPGDPPSDAQIAAAVDAYCDLNGCTGPSGPEPNSLQVAAAVVTYCDNRGECRGPTGETGDVGTAGPDGSDGVDGQDGSDGASGSDGQQGPGPTNEQIAAAVESYCAAHGGCRGPAGADGEDSDVPGPQGPQGEPGPTCPGGVEPIEWTVNQARSGLVGLEPGTYFICPTAGT